MSINFIHASTFLKHRNHAKLSTESPDQLKQSDKDRPSRMTILREEEENNKPIVSLRPQRMS